MLMGNGNDKITNKKRLTWEKWVGLVCDSIKRSWSKGYYAICPNTKKETLQTCSIWNH